MNRIFVQIFLLLFTVSTLTFTSAVEAKTTFAVIGTGGLTGVYYPTGGAIAKIVNKKRKKHGIRLTVESTSGSVYNVNSVIDGQFEFGIVQSDKQYDAIKGIGEWKSRGAQTELRSVFSIFPESVALITAVDANINALADLRNKRINLGNPGSGHLGNALDILRTIGLKPNRDFKPLYHNIVDVPGLLQDGSLDAFFYTVGHPNSALKEATAGSRKVKFISINNEKINNLVTSLPYYSNMEIPIAFYPGAKNKKNIKTFGVCATLVTSAKVPNSVVYAITRTILENLESFKMLHPAYAQTTKSNMLKCNSAPFHPGSMKYYREINLK